MKRTLIGLSLAALILVLLIWLLPRGGETPSWPPTPSESVAGGIAGALTAEPSSTPELAAVVEEQATDLEELAPDEPPLLSGYVTGEGAGIEGAQLFFFSTAKVEDLITRFDDIAAGLGGQIPHIPTLMDRVRGELERFRSSAVTTRSGEDGYYELRDVAPGGYLTLVVADDWLFRYGDVVSLAKEHLRELDVTLERGVSIAGNVVQPGGAGISGVRVIAEYRPASMPSVGKVVRRLLKYVNGEFLKGPFEVVSDESGAFHIDALPPGSYDITAYSARGLSSTTENVETGATGVIVYFGAGAVLEGVVVADNGEPVPNLEVQLESKSSLVELPLPAVPFTEAINVMNQYLGEGPRRTVSGEDGSFRFSSLGAGEYRLMIEQSGYLSRSEKVLLDWGEEVSLGQIPVSLGKFIRGVVRDTSGVPIGNATVMARPDQVGMMNMGTMIRDFMTGRMRTTTDVDGVFVLSGLGRGPFEVTASAKGYSQGQQGKVETGTESLELVLGTAETWRGIVVNAADARPIPGVRVSSGMTRSLTDAEGRFALTGVSAMGPGGPFGGGGGRRPRRGNRDEPAGPATVTVETNCKGYLSERVEVELENPPDEIVIEIAVAPRVEGLVLDPEGKPEPGALVRLIPGIPEEVGDFLGVDSSLIFFAVTVTDLKGRFSFDDYFAPGDDDLFVIADHVTHARGRSEGFRMSDLATEPRDITVSLQAGATIRGVVTDGSQPVNAAVVRLSRQRDMNWRERMMMSMMGLGGGGQTKHTNSRGEFSYEKVLPGEYEVSATKVGFTQSKKETVTLTEGVTREINFDLDPGETLAGSVVDDRGTPLVGASVRVLQTENPRMLETARVLGGAYQRTITDELGSYELTGLPRATYVVIGEMSGFSRSESSRVDPAFRGTVDLVLVPTASLLGKVLDQESGEPITNFQIMVHDLTKNEPAWAADAREVNDPDGFFSRDELRAGELEIEIRAAGFVTTKTPVTLAPGTLQEETFFLPTAGRLSGVVRDPQGRPLESAAVALAKPQSAESDNDEEAIQAYFTEAMLDERVFTDADGRFALDNVPSGSQTVVVTHGDYVQKREDGVEVPRGQQLELDVTLSEGFSIAGTVVDPIGNSVSEHFLFLRGVDSLSGINKTDRSDSQGGFSFTGLTAGSYRIVSAGSDDELSAPVLLEISESKDDVVITVLTVPPVPEPPQDG